MSCEHKTLRRLTKDKSCPICEPVFELPTPAKTDVLAHLAQQTPEQLYALLCATQARMCRLSFAEFFKQAWHVHESIPLEWNWHLEAMCWHLEKMLEGWWMRRVWEPTKIPQNLVMNVPPGSAKSRLLSVMFPAWCWIHYPEMSFRCLSANPTNVKRDALLFRDLVTSKWYTDRFRPTWTLREDQDAVRAMKNTAGGTRLSLGFAASGTGDRADCQLIDDPHDAREVFSDERRKTTLQQWDLKHYSRVNDAKVSMRIGVMQRLHVEDWTSHVINQGWSSLVIPNEYDPEIQSSGFGWKDPRTKPGELMFPARFGPSQILEYKTSLGTLGYETQFNQKPALLDGNLFKRIWWRFYKTGDAPRLYGCNEYSSIELPKLEYKVMAVDAAFKGNEGSDRVAIIVVGALGVDRFVLDLKAERMDFLQTLKAIVQMYEKHKPSKTIIEEAANGHAILSALQKVVPGLIGVKAEGGKIARANAVSPQVESACVYLPDSAPWLDDFVTELGRFPKGANDDIVDAFTYALNAMKVAPDVARSLLLGSFR